MSDYKYDAVVVSVHDGDTVVVDLDLGLCQWWRGLTVRLYGIDAPEMITLEGVNAKIYLADVLKVGTKVEVETIKDKADKYGGRWLGIIRVLRIPGDLVAVNDLMVSVGHAKLWSGKGKKPN